NAPAIASVPARRPAARNVLLPAEGQAAVPAVSGFHPNFGFVSKHGWLGFQRKAYDTCAGKTKSAAAVTHAVQKGKAQFAAEAAGFFSTSVFAASPSGRTLMYR